MKMKKYEDFDAFYADQETWKKTILRALRKFVAKIAPKLEESVKWGNGCWLKGETPVAYTYAGWPDHVQLGFFMGSQLKDPEGLLEGKGKFVRFIKLKKASEIDEAAFGKLLKQASR